MKKCSHKYNDEKINCLNNEYKVNNKAKFSISDDYLAGKVLMESGSKVAFDGDPRKYISFWHGIGRILSIYGEQYGLIYDIYNHVVQKRQLML